MDRFFSYLLAIAVGLGTGALLTNPSSRAAWQNQGADAGLTGDGAFRDGVYLGKLTAEHGRPPRPPRGRWSTEKDRASFVAGYRRGYNDSLASAAPDRQHKTQ